MKNDIVQKNYANGSYTFKLYKALSDRSISINKFMRDTETPYSTFRRYAQGTIQRVDLELVDRWCGYLKCTLSDIVEYSPS